MTRRKILGVSQSALFYALIFLLTSCSHPLASAATYREIVMADHPVAFYRLDETSGTTAKDQTGNYPATYKGSPSLDQPSLHTADSDPSVRVNGDYVDASNVSNHSRWPGITFEAWVEITRPAPSDEEHVINFSTATGGHAPGLFHDSPSNKIKWAVGSSTSFALSNLPYSDGVHYIVGTVGKTNVSKLYIDGKLQTQKGKISVRPSSNWLLAIGCDHDYGPVTTSFWQGRLDDVAIYDHALSATQIAAHYTAGK